MSFRFASRALVAALAVAATLTAGCGPRQLSLTLTVDSTGCTLALPAGGSILYQVNANGAIDDAGAGSFCGGCLALDGAIDSGDQLVAFLRAHAPACPGVHPDTLLGVRVTGWSTADCPQPSAPAFCVDGPTVLVPDGAHDSTLALDLACHPQCAAACTPITCAAAHKDCGPISDGCNAVLDCGMCKPPARCAGGGVPNVCAKP
jgi:hypothetical protein